MSTISQEQAYRAMFVFLERYYELTQTDDVGALLGSMRLLEDGRPVDAAMWEEWQACIRDVTAEAPEGA